MKVSNFLFAFLIITLFCGSKNRTNFPDLNGKYVYYNYQTWGDVYEKSEIMCWEFNRTRKGTFYRNFWSFSSDGWTNKKKEGITSYREWKVDEDIFFERLWKTSYSQWETHNFEYIDENTFFLDGKLFKRE